MRTNLLAFHCAVFAALTTAGSAVDATGAKSAAPKAAMGTPLTAASFDFPKSIFGIPPTIKEGRNPFFPEATTPVRRDDKSSKPAVDAQTIVLNGITSGVKPTAMINGRTFEEGETGNIKLKEGNLLAIQCLEIKIQSAVILYNGQKRELRLRTGI
jgi:hypothetical protein